MTYKVLVIEDDAVISNLLSLYLRKMGHNVLDTVYNSEKALDAIHNLQPDLILLDIHLDGHRDGIEIAQIIDREYQIPYIFITAFSDQSTLERVKGLNHKAYIIKPFKEDDVRASIILGMSDTEDPVETRLTLEELNKYSASPLSKKEFIVLQELSQGLTNKEIAAQLNVSDHTIKWHCKNIYSKIGVKTRTAATKFLRDFSDSKFKL